MNVAFRPRRSMRSETAQLAFVAAFTLALASAFPYGALAPERSRERPARPARAGCAIVVLSEEEESKALAAARSSWSVGSDGVKRLRIELFEDLPEACQGPVADAAWRMRRERCAAGPYEPDDAQTDMRAPAPAILEPPKEKPSGIAFPREEMLRIE